MNWPAPTPGQNRQRELETDLRDLFRECFECTPKHKSDADRAYDCVDAFISRIAEAGANNADFELALIRAVRQTHNARSGGQEN